MRTKIKQDARLVTRTRGAVPPISLSDYLLMAGMVLELTISSDLLTYAGYAYASDGGPYFAKLHPATYLIVLSSAGFIFGKFFARQQGDVWFVRSLAALVMTLAYCLLSTGLENAAILLDNYLPAILVAWRMQSFNARTMRVQAAVTRTVLMANFILAGCEAIYGENIIPLYLNGKPYVPLAADFRPTALLDHPLTGSVICMIGLAIRPKARPVACLFYLLTCAIAFLAFGGRTAIALCLVAIGFRPAMHFCRLQSRRSRRILDFFAICLLATLLMASTAALFFAAGFGGRFFGHLYWDGSAQTRLYQWSILTDMTWRDFIFGMTRADIAAKIVPLQLETGVDVIENFLLQQYISLGAIGFGLFFISLSALIFQCWKSSPLDGRILLITVFLAAFASNSLAHKSIILTQLVAACACTRLRSAKNRNDTGSHKEQRWSALRAAA